jgi:hypothetical protein
MEKEDGSHPGIDKPQLYQAMKHTQVGRGDLIFIVAYISSWLTLVIVAFQLQHIWFFQQLVTSRGLFICALVLLAISLGVSSLIERRMARREPAQFE